MVDGMTNVSFPGGAGPSPTPSPAASQGAAPSAESGNGTPQYITQAQALELEERLKKLVQSRSDQSESRIMNRVKSDLDSLKKAIAIQRASGINITPEQEKSLRSHVIENAFAGEEETTTQAPVSSPGATTVASQPPAGPGAETVADPVSMMVNQRVNVLLQKYGMDLNPQTDPEVQTVNSRDPFEFVNQYEQALIQKKARMASQGDISRMPVAASGAGTQGHDALVAELAELNAHPTPQSIPRMQELLKQLQRN